MDSKRRFLERLFDAAKDPRNANQLYFHEDGIHLVVSKEPVYEFPKTASLCRNLNMYRLLVDKDKEPIPGKSIYGLPRQRLGEMTKEQFCAIPRRPVRPKPSSSQSLSSAVAMGARPTGIAPGATRAKRPPTTDTITSEEDEDTEVEGEDDEDEEDEEEEDDDESGEEEDESGRSGEEEEVDKEDKERRALPSPPLPSMMLMAEEEDLNTKRSRMFIHTDIADTVSVAAMLKTPLQYQHRHGQQQSSVRWDDQEEDMLVGVGGEADFALINFAKHHLHHESSPAKHIFFKTGETSSGRNTPLADPLVLASKSSSALSNDSAHSSLAEEMANLAWWPGEDHHQTASPSPIRGSSSPASHPLFRLVGKKSSAEDGFEDDE
ncbi:hypothetical protein BASA81_002133 [Batrachochytrium salamandrivorans]|nr:hypothetical protein BASA81_002133 [Batrachochytrium salamandrivorans]